MATIRYRYFNTNEEYMVWYNSKKYLIKIHSVNVKDNKISVKYWNIKELELK